MIRHIVILHFKKDLHDDYLALMERTRPYIEQMSGIEHYKLFFNVSKYVPKDVTSIGVEILFKNDIALEDFMNNPKHYEANKLFENYYADPPYMVLTHEV